MGKADGVSESHRKVVPSFWTDPDVKRPLTLEQKALLLYLFTSPHSTMIGLYYLPLDYASAETGLSTEAIRAHLGGALSRFVAYDEETEEVFVYNMARHQIADEMKGGDKRKPMVERLLAGIHSSRLRRQFLNRYARWDLVVPAPSVEAPLAGPSEGAWEGASQASPHAIAVAAAAAAAEQDLSPGGDDSGTPDAPSRPAVSSPERRSGGWPAEFARMYKAIGMRPPAEIGRMLKPAVDEHGLERIREAWSYYIRQAPYLRFGKLDPDRRDTTHMSPADFVKNLATWLEKTQPIGEVADAVAAG